ncbi:MAG: ATP-binding cassette domain-containing protein [Gammaproteobacteria bacterium]|nr:ATP-binding cassette domain-containing protein [Gammaproteobacteria bacterium]
MEPPEGAIPSGGTDLLRLKEIRKRYATTVALSGASLSVRPGEIHALLGENGAGKTTLMSVLDGITRPNSGEIFWRGGRVEIASPQAAAALGIGMVHQHDRLVPALTVAENFALALGGRFRLDMDSVRGTVKEVERRFGGNVDPDAIVAGLSVGQRQWVSLLRVLAQDVTLLVLDEPTATLTPLERDVLFDALREYRALGLSVIFITHKLDEVFAVSDRVTVLRNGHEVATLDTAATDRQELVIHMVGRRIETGFDPPPTTVGRPLLRIEGLHISGERRSVQDVGLKVRAGEIVGIAGVDGNGQRELIEVICGIREADKGEIWFDDGSRCWHHGLSASIARIPEDRHRHGLARGLALWENLHLGRWRQRGLVHQGLIDRQKAHRMCAALLERFDVRAAGPDQLAGELSGGNQQKAVLARELGDQPELVIAMNPCRGLDISAARFVLEQLLAVRGRGGGVLFVSYDLDEILSVADRILVMSSGRIAGEVLPGDGAAERIGLLMSGEKLDQS